MQEPLVERVVYPYAERIVNSWVTIQRTRVLPRPGRITRRRGDRVAGDTVIGEWDALGGYLLVEMDQALGRRGRDARKVAKKRVGEKVLEGVEPDMTRSLYPEKLYIWARISQYLNGLRKVAKYRRLRRKSA